MELNKILRHKKDIEQFLEKIKEAKQIAVDFEFIRKKTYYPIPCLMQISDGNEIACIDLLENNLNEFLINKIFTHEREVIIHSCTQDLEIIECISKVIPKKVFDTQIAASFLGYGYQIGYAELIFKLFKIELDKSSKLTDWTQRPLTDNQIEYAVNDVKYLLKASNILKKNLSDEKKDSWCKEEIENCINKYKKSRSEKELFKKVKIIKSFKGGKKTLAKVIAVWREEKAKQINLPRNWVFNEEVLEKIVNHVYENNSIKNNDFFDENFNEKDHYDLISFIDENKNNSIYHEQNITNKLSKTNKDFISYIYNQLKMESINLGIAHEVFIPKKDLISMVNFKDLNSKIINDWRGSNMSKKVYEEIILFLEKN